jgi:hypothetical protein
MRRRALLQAAAALALPAAASGCAAPPSPASPSVPEPPRPGALGVAPTVTAAAAPPPAGAAAPSASPAGAAAPSAPPAGASASPARTAASPAPVWARVVARVGQNHGHVFEVKPGDVAAGVEKTFDLTGGASHAHAVTITASEWQRLGAGEILRKQSTRDGHAHRLYVRCAPAVDPPEMVSVCAVEIGGKDDHDLLINAADLAAKAERTYDIQGIANHTHAVRLTAADFERLLRGEQINTRTGPAQPGEDHSHVVFVRYPKK